MVWVNRVRDGVGQPSEGRCGSTESTTLKKYRELGRGDKFSFL